MADIVTTQTLVDTSGIKYVTKLTNYSDGTGETDVTKVTAANTTFMTEDGNRKIAKVWFSVNTANLKSAVEIKWAGVTNSTALLLSGQGFFDFREAGDEITNNATTPSGNVLLSTKNFASGDNYTLVIEFR
jgi:hypothetical protein